MKQDRHFPEEVKPMNRWELKLKLEVMRCDAMQCGVDERVDEVLFGDNRIAGPSV